MFLSFSFVCNLCRLCEKIATAFTFCYHVNIHVYSTLRDVTMMEASICACLRKIWKDLAYETFGGIFSRLCCIIVSGTILKKKFSQHKMSTKGRYEKEAFCKLFCPQPQSSSVSASSPTGHRKAVWHVSGEQTYRCEPMIRNLYSLLLTSQSMKMNGPQMLKFDECTR